MAAVCEDPKWRNGVTRVKQSKIDWDEFCVQHMKAISVTTKKRLGSHASMEQRVLECYVKEGGRVKR